MLLALMLGWIITQHRAWQPLAATRFVRIDGNSTICTGAGDSGYDGTPSHTNCAKRVPSDCDSITAGNTCVFRSNDPGHDGTLDANYAGQLTPNNPNTTYDCPTRDCYLTNPISRYCLTNSQSNVTIKNLVFNDCTLEMWKPGNTGVIVDNVLVQDVDGTTTNDSTCRSNAQAIFGGGTNNTVRNSTFKGSYGSTNCTDTFAQQSGFSETNLTVTNVTVLGGGNTCVGLAVNAATTSGVIDGLTVGASQNHTFSGNASGLTIRNSVFLPSTSFREAVDLRTVGGLTMLNNVFIGTTVKLANLGQSGASATGSIKLRNNIFLNYTGGDSRAMIWLSEPSSAVFDIDYNAYVGTRGLDTDGTTRGNVNQTTWKEDRNAYTATSYVADATSDGTLDTGAGSLTTWRSHASNPDASGFDAHSIYLANKDYRTGSLAYTVSIFGTSAPTWGGPLASIPTSTTFTTNSNWQEDGAKSHVIEIDRDGTLRTITGVSSSTYTFTPAKSNMVGNHWFNSWGRQDADGDTTANMTTVGPTNYAFCSVSGSALRDAGDPSLCGHTAADNNSDGTARCDIGPNEASSTNCGDTTAPSDPTLTVGQTANFNELQLTWTASTDTGGSGLSGYQILRGTSSNGETPLTTVGPGLLAYLDTTGSAYTTYYYKVKAYDGAGNYSAGASEQSSYFTSGGSAESMEDVDPLNVVSGDCVETVVSSPTAHQGSKSVTSGWIAQLPSASFGAAIQFCGMGITYPVAKDFTVAPNISFWVYPADSDTADWLSLFNGASGWSSCNAYGTLQGYAGPFRILITSSLGGAFNFVGRLNTMTPGQWNRVIVPRSRFVVTNTSTDAWAGVISVGFGIMPCSSDAETASTLTAYIDDISLTSTAANIP